MSGQWPCGQSWGNKGIRPKRNSDGKEGPALPWAVCLTEDMWPSLQGNPALCLETKGTQGQDELTQALTCHRGARR